MSDEAFAQLAVREAKRTSGLIFRGKCDSDMTPSTTALDIVELSKFGDDFFNDKYYAQVIKNANSVGNAPEGEIRPISDYDSATGDFTCDAFTQNVEPSDEILILHESILFLTLFPTIIGTPADTDVSTDIANLDTKLGTPADTDVSTDIENVQTAVDGLSLLSTKEKSLLGIGVFPGFQDYFNTVANDGEPDTTYWTRIQAGLGRAIVMTDTATEPGYLRCYGGDATNQDGIVHTKDKRVFSLKNGVTTIHFKSYVNMDWAGGGDDELGIGFASNDAAPTGIELLSTAAAHVASIVADSGTPNAHSSDGTNLETTDLSAFISDNTWFVLEIVISASDVKFYIDNVLRATHSTKVPASVWQLIVGATCRDNSNGYIYAEKVETWGE